MITEVLKVKKNFAVVRMLHPVAFTLCLVSALEDTVFGARLAVYFAIPFCLANHHAGSIAALILFLWTQAPA
jgi:hypothetical protein